MQSRNASPETSYRGYEPQVLVSGNLIRTESDFWNQVWNQNRGFSFVKEQELNWNCYLGFSRTQTGSGIFLIKKGLEERGANWRLTSS
jgi:hypothetical protein